LAKSFRSNDLLARFGGEEFIIFLVGTPLESAIRVLEKLLQTIEALRVSLSDGRVIRCTASIGATELHHGEEVETLISRADSMLYRAKHNGRNQLQVSSQFATVVYDYEH
jgi:diguanylate cyclase